MSSQYVVLVLDEFPGQLHQTDFCIPSSTDSAHFFEHCHVTFLGAREIKQVRDIFIESSLFLHLIY